MDEFAGLDVPTEIKNNLEKAFQQIVHDKPITFKRFLSSDSERKRKMEILAHAKPIGILGKIG
jgi:thymidylate synthase ThyX